MEYAFLKIDIRSPFPTTQCGHSCQVEKLSDYHDPLYARVFALRDENVFIIHFSFDLLAFDLEHRNELQDYFRSYYQDDNLHLVTSATHTHYANSVRDPDYVKYLCDLLKKETVKLRFSKIDDVSVSFDRMHSTAIGRSRISGYETNNEYLSLIRFYQKEHNFFSILYYNCHPTILKADTPYFSAEYPGYVLSQLEQACPDCDFTFLQGAAGDISSRFVRDGQDYEALRKLGDALLKDLSLLLEKEPVKHPLRLSYQEKEILFEHEFVPIDLSGIRSDLSKRELETIRIGQQERKKLEERNNAIFGSPIDKAIVSALDLCAVRLIFFPNEIFSQYMDYTDQKHELLVSYSNGYGPYVLPIDFGFITYEMFTDTLTRKSQERIIETLKPI